MTVGERLKFAIKFLVSHILYGLGLLQLWQRIALNRRAVVLMYHRVLTPSERRESASHPAIIVEQETFALHMSLVKRRFKVLTLDQFTEKMERRIPFENSSCLITFDDGWKDNYTHALPILKKYKLPAVVFLPVNYIGQKRLFWQESLVQVLHLAVMVGRQDSGKSSRLREIVAPLGLGEVLDIQGDNPRPWIIASISQKRKRFTPASVEEVVRMLKKELDVEQGNASAIDGFLTWDEIRAMSREGIQFGGHGAEHHLLSHLTVDEARDEVEGAKAMIASQLKEVPCSFSYPRGYWTPQVVELVKKAGYRLAFLAKGGPVRCEDDLYTLQRINIFEEGTQSRPMFLARLVGLF